MRIDELSLQLERRPSTLSHLLTQLQDARDFHDPDTASSSGGSHVPNQPLTTSSHRGMPSRDSGLPHTLSRGPVSSSLRTLRVQHACVHMAQEP